MHFKKTAQISAAQHPAALKSKLERPSRSAVIPQHQQPSNRLEALQARVRRAYRRWSDAREYSLHDSVSWRWLATVEALQERVLLSGAPPIFYVHSTTVNGQFTVYPAKFLLDNNGNPVPDPNLTGPNAGSTKTNYNLYDADGHPMKNANPDGNLIVPADYSINGAITNAQIYQNPLSQVVSDISGVNVTYVDDVGFGLMANDFRAGGAQDLQRPGGPYLPFVSTPFVPAFTDAASYNLGLQSAYDGIPLAVTDIAGGAENIFGNFFRTTPQDTNGPFGLTAANGNSIAAGYSYGQGLAGATLDVDTADAPFVINGSPTDDFSSDSCTLQSNGNLQIDEELLDGESENVLFDPEGDIIEESITYSGPDLTGSIQSHTVDYTGGATTQAVTAPTDGSQVTLPGVVPGEDINVQVQYSTTDENENGEGESLTIATSGGDSVSDASYNTTSSYNFIATASDETISAIPVGWDGDESGTVTVTISSFTGLGISPAQENALSTTSADLNTEAAGIATIADAIQAGSASYDLGASDAAWATSALQSEASSDFSNLAIDPVDTDYKVIVRPAKTTSAIFSEAKNFKGIKNAGPLAASINALELNQERSINLAAAGYATANKLDGAIAIGDKTWTKRQTSTLKSYKRQLAALLATQTSLANREVIQLNKAGLGSTSVSSGDVNNFEEEINDDGLPSQLASDLSALSVNATTQSQIQQALFSQDINIASGTYSSILTNASLETDLKQVAALLKTG